MASITLTESSKFTQNDLIAGVIEDVVTVNQMYQFLPFMGFSGNALQYNRENALGGVSTHTVGDTLTNTAATYTSVTAALTTIGGVAEVNGFIGATKSNYTDQVQQAISSVAKNAGRKYQNLLINGDSGTTATEFDGLLQLVSSGQTVDATATDGDVLSFEKLDEGISLVTAKDGQVDWICMNDRELRKYMSLLRAVGGASINEVISLPDGSQVIGYRGIPIFRNDYVPITQTEGSSTDATTILMGTFDDGGRNGISGLTSEMDAGMHVKVVGQSETKDAEIYQVLWYAGLANFSDKGLAAISGIVPA